MNKNLDPIILIAEDDPDDALMLKDAFEEVGINKAVFLDNGKILIEYLGELLNNNKIPTLIIVDLNMPVLNGRDVIKRLKTNTQTVEIPLIVLSTIKNEEDIRQVLALGADDFYSKPSTFIDLINIATAISSKWLT
jgi:two-component system response regulator